MATRKRKSALPAVRRTIQSLGNRIESEKFARGQGDGEFVPLTYDPTNTTWPENGWHHRRTSRAGYDRETGILRIQFFSNGAVYDYGTSHPVPPDVAKRFRRVDSPGRFINSTLNGYGYERVI